MADIFLSPEAQAKFTWNTGFMRNGDAPGWLVATYAKQREAERGQIVEWLRSLSGGGPDRFPLSHHYGDVIANGEHLENGDG